MKIKRGREDRELWIDGWLDSWESSVIFATSVIMPEMGVWRVGVTSCYYYCITSYESSVVASLLLIIIKYIIIIDYIIMYTVKPHPSLLPQIDSLWTSRYVYGIAGVLWTNSPIFNHLCTPRLSSSML